MAWHVINRHCGPNPDSAAREQTSWCCIAPLEADALQVFCSKVSPNCGACPLQADCDYARNNGRRYGSKTGLTLTDLEDLPATAWRMPDRQHMPTAATFSQHTPAMEASPAEHAEPGIQSVPHGLEAAAEHAEPGTQSVPHGLGAAAEHAEPGLQSASRGLHAAQEHAMPAVPLLLGAIGSQQEEVARLVQAAASMREVSAAAEHGNR